MKVTKIAGFTEDEIAEITAAGKVLGTVAKAFETGEVDTLDERSAAIVAAVQDVLNRIK